MCLQSRTDEVITPGITESLPSQETREGPLYQSITQSTRVYYLNKIVRVEDWETVKGLTFRFRQEEENGQMMSGNGTGSKILDRVRP